MVITFVIRCGLRMLFTIICEYYVQYYAMKIHDFKKSLRSALHHFRGEPWGDFGCSNRFCSRSSSLVKLCQVLNVLQEATHCDDLLEVSLFIINSLSCHPTISGL